MAITRDAVAQGILILSEAMEMCPPIAAKYGNEAFPGAIGQDDPFSLFCEAKRNLEAMKRLYFGESDGDHD